MFSFKKRRNPFQPQTTQHKRSREVTVSDNEKELQDLRNQLSNCQGVRSITKSKLLCKRIKNLEAQHSTEKKIQDMEKLLARIENVECRIQRNDQRGKNRTMKLDNRLYPPLPETKRNRLKKMSQRSAKQYMISRSFKKRFAVMTGKKNGVEVRNNDSYDTCLKCNIGRIIDHETSRAICPRCGENVPFASYILDTKDNERANLENPAKQTLEHLQKRSEQYR